ncbi:hypothetical protein PHYSODRAFT_261523 [Phytophthora sojae]|uniref:Uncharacterized protein n=1 Tax=Phytophthora sojae (strain P6497) TaxID=1094619 RepID=G4ZZU5_PHYSP|nr:hypothetical protein PHYSODRAFT_261523 [Phytophthora sojae]EGZ11242.1 hypothetical protein PHYSODRAFT_261523 [Phytophthora sojae]|eukprot:XP_009533987.1 hypothetical protein PHYSODRAFT_261523 [Phytophthora sojae]
METPEAARSDPKWVDCMTLAFPRELPMQYEFEELRFYVRACYPHYYNLITRMLNSKRAKVVTVTDNPGIGKSLFYAYFFLRYRAENEATSIITISFAKENNASVLKEVVVWKGDRVVAATSNSLAIGNLIEKAEKEAKSNVIHLYNGSPKIAAASARAVCFTSSDKSWFDHIKKSQYRPKLFMPLWDLRELQTAAKALHLSVLGGDESPKALNQDEVEVRFITFGGIVREYLASDQDFVYQRQHDIEKMVGQFNDAGIARRLLQDLESEMVLGC